MKSMKRRKLREFWMVEDRGGLLFGPYFFMREAKADIGDVYVRVVKVREVRKS